VNSAPSLPVSTSISPDHHPDIGDRFENFFGRLIHRNGGREVLIFHD
jgi:hypothetical protein